MKNPEKIKIYCVLRVVQNPQTGESLVAYVHESIQGLTTEPREAAWFQDKEVARELARDCTGIVWEKIFEE